MADVLHAATVVLLRDGDDGLETLMLRKNSRLAFGGMWVFPGGRIDDGDRVADADELTAAANAAVREAAEESGLVVPSSALIPFSHWTPPLVAPKRFLTWFFLAPAPSAVVTIDRGEIHGDRRAVAAQSAEDALEQRRRAPLETAAHVQDDVTAVFALHFNGQALRAHRITLSGYVKVTTRARTEFSSVVTVPRHNRNTCA